MTTVLCDACGIFDVDPPDHYCELCHERMDNEYFAQLSRRPDLPSRGALRPLDAGRASAEHTFRRTHPGH